MTYANITTTTVSTQVLTIPVTLPSIDTIKIDTHTTVMSANRHIQLHTVSTR